MKSFRLSFFLFLSPFLLLAQTTRNYYVSDTGSDSNPGTSTQPFRTVQKCVSQFRDTMQVICNCAGTFNEEIAITAGGPSLDKRSKIIAWDTDGDGSLRDETFVLDGQGTRNETIKAVTGARPDNIEIAWATFRNYDPDGGCNIDDDGELHFIKIVCWGNGGCADWWIHDNLFEKLGKSCNVESHYIAIQPSDAPRLIVENNRFDSIGGFIMRYVGGTGIKFRNNHVLIQGTGLKAWDDPDSIEITGNIFECDGNGINKPGDTRCSGQAAVSLSNNVAYSQIRNNLFIDCVTPINIGTDDRFGTKKNGPHLVEGNRIYQSGKVCNAYAPAIEVSDRSDTTIYGDSVYVFDVTVRNNIIAWVDSTRISTGTAFSLSAGHPFPFASNIRIYNNTVRSYGRGMLLSLAGTFRYQLNGVVVRNNIFSDIKDEYLTLAGTLAAWPDSARELNWDSDYNLFSGRDRITWGGTRYTLAQWKTAKGEDLNSRVASPAFVADSSRLRPLFKLSAGDTTALNKGNTIASVAGDFSGLPRPMGGAWDIGAHELKQKRIHFASASAGNDANPGTADQPFRTLGRGLDMWNGADQFELRGAGVFGEELVLDQGGLNADSLNTMLPWDTDGDGSVADETFVLDGGNTLRVALQTDSVAAPDYVKISGLTFRNYALPGCDTLFESRFLSLKGNPSNNLVGWRLEGNTFRNLARTCETSGRTGGIRASAVRDLRIERNAFDSINGAVLNVVQGTGILFAENNVRMVGHGVTSSQNVDSLRVTDNIFIGDGNGATTGGGCKKQYAVEIVNGARYGVIRENIMFGCSGGIRFGLNTKGTRSNMHHIVERNTIYLNDAVCKADRPGIVIADVGAVAASGDSLHIEDILIRNNLLVFNGDAVNSGGAIKLAAGHPYPFVNDIRIYNNTIYGFDQGVLVRQGEDSEGELYPYRINGVKIKNNLFSHIADAQFKLQSGAWRTALPTGWQSDYNVFGGIDQFRWEGKKTLTTWRQKTGQDLRSVLCEPVFVPGDTVFHLSRIDLCAIGAGVTLSEVTDDIDGDIRPGGGVDIGADEYVAGGLARVAAGENFADAAERNGSESVLSGLRAYPNPASERAYLEFFLTKPQEVTMQVWGITGVRANLPEQTLFLEQGWHRVEMGLNELPDGVWLVALKTGVSEHTARIVVIR